MVTNQTSELLSKVVTFDEALKEAEKFNTKNLLLGNGFSIACWENFNYKSLFQEADFSQRNHIKDIFLNLDTEDFEEVVSSIEIGHSIIKAYNQNVLLHILHIIFN